MPSAVCGGGPNDWQIIHQQEDCSERCWLYAWIWGNCIWKILLLVCHLEVPMYRHHSLADVQWLVGAKPNLQRSVLSYIVNLRLFQRCGHDHQARHILQNITKIHLIYALAYFYESWYWINSGCGWLAQDGCTLNATHCTFTSNNAEVAGGAIYAVVGHGVQGLSVVENRIHFELWHIFVLKVPRNIAFSLMDPHHTASQFWHLVWNRFNIYWIGFEKPSPMMWWCDCGSSLCGRLLWNADVLPTHGCVHKSLVPMRREKGHGTAYKMGMTFEKQNEDHGVQVSNWFFCYVVQICHIRFMGDERVVRGLPHECGMTYWDHRERIFILSILPLCLFNIGDVTWSLKSAHSSHPRKAVMSEPCLLPLVSSHVADIEYSF